MKYKQIEREGMFVLCYDEKMKLVKEYGPFSEKNFDIEISGDEFVRFFDLVSLKYPRCNLESFEVNNIFFVSVLYYAVKGKEED